MQTYTDLYALKPSALSNSIWKENQCPTGRARSCAPLSGDLPALDAREKRLSKRGRYIFIFSNDCVNFWFQWAQALIVNYFKIQFWKPLIRIEQKLGFKAKFVLISFEFKTIQILTLNCLKFGIFEMVLKQFKIWF